MSVMNVALDYIGILERKCYGSLIAKDIAVHIHLINHCGWKMMNRPAIPEIKCVQCYTLMRHKGTVSVFGNPRHFMYECVTCLVTCKFNNSNKETLWTFPQHTRYGRGK